MPRLKIRTALFRLPIAFTTLAFGMMIFVFPFFSDDLWYIAPVRDRFLGIDGAFPWEGLRECWREHYMTDNLRLSNITFTFFMLMPRWIGASLTVIALWTNLMLLCRLSGSSKDTPLSSVWICLLFSTALPWLNEQVILNFAINYVWSGALAILAALVILSPRQPRLWAAALLGLLCGAWHEGFGVPLLGATAVLMIFRPGRYITPANIAMTLGLAAGTIYLLTCPGALLRGRFAEFFHLSTIFLILPRHIMMWIFLLSSLAAYCIPGARRRLDGELLLFIAGACIVNFVINLATHCTIRVAWCSELLSIAGTVHCGLAIYGSARGKRTIATAARICTALAGALLATHLIAADITTMRVASRLKHLIEEYRRPGDRVIFADYINQYDAPFIALGKSGLELFSDLWYQQCLEKTYGIYGRKRVVDERLRRVTAGSGEPAPGTPGLRRLGTCFFMPNDGQFPKGQTWQREGTAIINGRETRRNITVTPFVSEADGRDYVQVYPAARRIVFDTPEGIIIPGI